MTGRNRRRSLPASRLQITVALLHIVVNDKVMLTIRKTRWTVWLLWAAVTAVLFWRPMHTGWFPDEGYFAENTARVLRGELPGTDFASNYPGLFYFYNALIMTLFGKSLWSLRLGMLVLLAGVFTPTVYFLCRQRLSIWEATATTLLTLCLAVGYFPHVSGNWTAVFLIPAALLAYLHARGGALKKARWLGLGLILGTMFLIKPTIAVYAGFALLVHDALLSRNSHAGKSGVWEKVLPVAGLLLIPVVLIGLLQAHWRLSGFVIYVLPGGAAALLALTRLYQERSTVPFRRMTRQWLLILAGAAAVVLAYLLPYIIQGAAADWFWWIFIKYPGFYLENAYADYLDNLSRIGMVFLLALTLTGFAAIRHWKAGAVLLGVLVPAFLMLPGYRSVNGLLFAVLHLPVWMTLGISIGLAVLAVRKKHLDPLMTLLGLTGIFLLLNTYPLGVMSYGAFCLPPFLMLAGCLLFRQAASTPQRVVFSLLLGIGMITGLASAYGEIKIARSAKSPLFPAATYPVRLPEPRGGLRVPKSLGTKTLAVLDFIKTHSTRPDDVFLYSDAPEIYFLSDHINPTRYSYGFDAALSDGRDIIAALRDHNVRYVIVDRTRNSFEIPLLDFWLSQNFQRLTSLAAHPQAEPDIIVFERIHPNPSEEPGSDAQ